MRSLLLPGLFLLTALTWAGFLFATPTLASLTGQGASTGNTFTLDTLAAPTSLIATGGSSIALSWTATADTYASGHRVFRASTSGGPYSQIAELTPRTNTTYVDSPGTGTYYYVVRAYYQNWESANSNQASAAVSTDTGLLSCSANAAVTSSSGDNNGFETTASNACADGAGEAVDTDSGSDFSTSCASTNKDRHLFSSYGFSIPGGATINGIEVRLDARADTTSDTPFMCVELSWDAGSTWTAAKTTTTLTTAEASYTLASTSDTWGRTWASGDFSNANFRVRITNVANSTSRDFWLDWVAVRVTYTP